MKVQDIGFFIIFAVLLFLKKDKLFVIAGLVSLLLAIPLFATWVFFTAERLTWYASAFLSMAILLKVFFEKEKI